ISISQKNGITIASYGGQTPVAHVPDGPLKEALSSIHPRLEKTQGTPISKGQLISKWLIQKGVVVVVITTSSKVFRVKGFLDTENVPYLTEQEIRSIEEAGSKL
ncbi:hypothetical protein P691DRAFT_624001, partial [Macrolepiota fuliginosa MF-IS2]